MGRSSMYYYMSGPSEVVEERTVTIQLDGIIELNKNIDTEKSEISNI